MNLAGVYFNRGQYPKAAEFYEKQLAIAKELKDPSGESNAVMGLGLVYADWGQYDKAMSYYERALAICRALKDRKGEGNALNNLGIVYRDWGQYDKAVSCYEQSLAICRDLKNRNGQGAILNNLGTVYKDWGQYDKAVSYYEKSLAIKRDLKDRNGEGLSLNNLGRAMQHKGEAQKALELFQKGLAIYTEIKVPTRTPVALVADVYMDAGDLAKAEPLLKEANYNTSWGRFYLLKADYPEAREYYGKILKSAEENRNADSLFTAYTGLGAACEGLKDDAGAADQYEKAVKHTEEIRSSLSAAQREQFFDVKINGFYRTAPYEGLARVMLRLNRPLEAAKWSEYTKARLFAESISRRGRGRDRWCASGDRETGPRPHRPTGRAQEDQAGGIREEQQRADRCAGASE